MADNVTIQSATPATLPAGGTYAFDDVGGVLYQRQKISAGADGSAADVPGDGAAGLAVGGSLAHDAVESGNPVAIGGIARTANPTAVSALDRVRAWFTVLGKLVVQIGAPRELVTHQHTQIASSTSETTILSAGGSGVLHDLTALVITNQTATAVNVTIKDDTAGTTRMIIALAANGGAVLEWTRPVNQAVANKPWTATLSSGSVTVNFFVQAEKNV